VLLVCRRCRRPWMCSQVRPPTTTKPASIQPTAAWSCYCAA
jgi:hypothetical protein